MNETCSKSLKIGFSLETSKVTTRCKLAAHANLCMCKKLYFAYICEQESWLLPTERASAVKTRMNGLSCGEKNPDNTFSRFDTIPACDGTDRRPDRRLYLYVLQHC